MACTYSCSYCDYTQRSKREFLAHLRSKHNTGPLEFLKCPDCEFKSCYSANMKRHMATHSSEKPFSCLYCEYSSSTKGTLSLHVKLKHCKETRKLLECPKCEYKSFDSSGMKRHIKTHTSERPFKCDHCDFSSATKKGLSLHINCKHLSGPAQKTFECPQCKFKTCHKSSLVSHLKRHDPEREKPFKCDYCDYYSANKTNLSKHVACKHSNGSDKKIFECSKCEFKTSHNPSFLLHEKIHSSEEPFAFDYCVETDLYSCKYCDHSNRFKAGFLVHLRSKHSVGPLKFSPCPKCDFSSCSNHVMKNHIKTHNPERLFKCNYCDYSSTTNIGLSRHIEYKHCIGSDRKMLECPKCKFKTRRKESLHQHLRTHSSERPYKCTLCEYAASYTGGLTRHHRSVHSFSKILLECLKCKFKTRDKTGYKVHMNTHSSSEPFLCEYCDNYSSSFKGNVVSHMNVMHKNIRPTIRTHHACEYCDYSTQRKVSLNIHLRIDHGTGPTKLLKCTECEYSTCIKRSLLMHMRSHSSDKLFSCNICGHQANFVGNLKKHLKTKHGLGAIQTLYCHLCQYSTCNTSHLKRHISTHSDSRPFPCNMCDYNARHKGNLVRHIKKVHGEKTKLECKECKYSTFSQLRFNTHIETHSDGRTEETFSCDLCDYEAGQKSNLQRHVSAIHDTKTFKCKECQYYTRSKLQFRKHNIYKHSKERVFSCRICDCCYEKKATLRNHIKIKHGVKLSFEENAKILAESSDDDHSNCTKIN